MVGEFEFNAAVQRLLVSCGVADVTGEWIYNQEIGVGGVRWRFSPRFGGAFGNLRSANGSEV